MIYGGSGSPWELHALAKDETRGSGRQYISTVAVEIDENRNEPMHDRLDNQKPNP
jgi:hypothetical protein